MTGIMRYARTQNGLGCTEYFGRPVLGLHSQGMALGMPENEQVGNLRGFGVTAD